MGEWSEYFDDFPKENPANYVGKKFDPRRQLRSVKLSKTLLDKLVMDSKSWTRR